MSLVAMAPIPDSIYFPSLEKCLNGRELLISWKAVFSSLSYVPQKSNADLESFLLDPYVQNLLAEPFGATPTATPQTKSAFETKTAAINVTPTSESTYNISEIKEDALWLSKKAGIDEISALRLTVLEYQTRPYAQLLGDFSPEEAASLHEAGGNINTETSNLVPRKLLSDGLLSETQQSEANPQTNRRQRSLQIHLSERKHFLACAQLFLQTAITVTKQDSCSIGEGKGGKSADSLIARLGKIIIKSPGKKDLGYRETILKCVDSFEKTINGLSRGSGWLDQGDLQDALEIEWFTSQLFESIHLLEALLWLVQAEGRDQLQTSSVVLGWFRLVKQYDFFEQLSSTYLPVLPLITSLQSLVSVISFSLVNPGPSVDFLLDLQDHAIPEGAQGGQPYITDLEGITELHRIMIETADSPSPIASPAIFGWAIFLRTVRDISATRREAREVKQSERIVDNYEDDSITEDDSILSEAEVLGRRRRRASGGSETSFDGGIFDDIMDRVVDKSSSDDDIEFLARSAVDGSNVFDVLTTIASNQTEVSAASSRKIRCVVLDSARCFVLVVGYIPEIVNTVLSALTSGRDFWQLLRGNDIADDDDPLILFLLNDDLRENLLGLAMSRYPYERLPFLKIIRAVASCQSLQNDGIPMVMKSLERLTTFTYELPTGFREYETIQEEENTNTIQLTTPVMLFEPRKNMKYIMGHSHYGSQALIGSDDFIIPSGTAGRIVSDDGPKIAVFFHEYSGLRYLGKLIETALATGEFVDTTTSAEVDHDSLVEIVGLLATLLTTSIKLEIKNTGKIDPQGSSHRLLEEASDGLSRNRDIVSVIFSLFEEQLQYQAEGTGTEATLQLLITSMQFICALVPILPGRVWSFLSRSGLLELDGRGGKLTSILTSVELVIYRYDFLISCMHLFDALVEDSITYAVLRRSGSRTITRFGSVESLGTGVPDHMLSKVLCSFTRVAVDVFLNSCNWRYVSIEQRLNLSEIIAHTLHHILHYTYAVDDLSDPKSKLGGILAAAAEHTTDSFLSGSSGILRFQPILRALLDGFSTPDSTSQSPTPKLWRSYVQAVLQFTVTLVRLATVIDRPASQLEKLLFTVSPLIARLYAVHESYQTLVIQLLENLVISAAMSSGEPPSLLGHLGPQTSKNFLFMLSKLGKPIDDNAHVVAIWKLMSSVVSNRQQWFSIYLLTGKTPRETLKGDKSNQQVAAASTPLLTVALEELSHIENVPLPRALAMLEFISLAQNFWPWAMSDLQKKPTFITAISDYVERLSLSVESADTQTTIDACYQARIAAYIAEILAMHLYHSRQMGILEPAKATLKKLSFYRRSAVAVPNYNSSLHGNLKHNFEAKYKGCSLQDFKRTDLQAREFGRNYVYDVELAGKLLNSDQAWLGRKNDGLAEEMARANINLSLVDSQVAVLHGWKMLAVELSAVRSDSTVQTILAKTVSDCLISNMRTHLPEHVFTQLNQTRADFALILLQRLIEIDGKLPALRKLLATSWETLRHLNSSFETAVASGDADYYRTLLKILYLTLQVHTTEESELQSDSNGSTPQETAQKVQASNSRVEIVLDILEKVVAQGFQDVHRAIHERSEGSAPGDISLITAILQVCLRVPGVELRHNQVLTSMASFDTIRAATTLFSWSDKFAIDGDPIYGELSIQFLLELSSVPALAEQLALDGVLGHISNASITSYIRRANVSPFTDGAGPQRCYSMWVRGILSLLLNILDAVGAPVAADVAIFLNNFPNLLKQSVALFEAPDSTRSTRAMEAKHITYTTVSEVHSLALLTHMLSVFRESMTGILDIPDVAWDAVSVLENAEFWLGSRQVLREKILPLGPREAEWARQEAIGYCKNRLEEKMVDELTGIKEILTGEEV